MSNLRSKAQEIRAAGEAERGNFTPHGVPKRMYQYWLANTNSVNGNRIRSGRRKENFCHFWRVVAIWAPLMFLADKGEKFVTSKAGIVSIALALLATLFFVVTSTIGWMDFLVGLGVGIAVVAGVMGLIVGGTWLHDNKPKVLERIFIGLVGVGVLGLLTALVLDFGFIALAVVAGVIAGVAAFIFGVVMIGEWVSGVRAVAAEKREAEFDADDDHEAYQAPERKPLPAWLQVIGNFFKGVGDFLVLSAQIVRVKKWKICPIVEVDAS